MLGQMLFNGDRMPPQRARGLMWLTLARDSAAPDEAWIRESYNRAIAKANDDDRAMALQMLEHWVQGTQGLTGASVVGRVVGTLRFAHLQTYVFTPSRDRNPPRPARGPTASPRRAHSCRCRHGQPVAGLRRQQQVVDPDAPVLLPGAGLIVPEGVLAGLVRDGPQRVGQAEAEQGLEASRVSGRNSASLAQAAGL